MKTCTKCNESKDKSDFYNQSSKKDGLSPICKSCINEHQLFFNRTLKGRIKYIYSAQRKNSRARKMNLPNYNKKQFYDWVLLNGFYALWCQWVNSGYQKDFAPSPDRLDDYKPYTLENIRLVAWKENYDRSNRDERAGINRKRSLSVKQYKDGEFIKEYYSIRQAYRETKVDKADISKCCNKIRSSAGGFQWEFA